MARAARKAQMALVGDDDAEPADTGHNSEHEERLFHGFVAQFADADRRVKEAQAARKKIHNAAKAEGFQVQEIKQAVLMSEWSQEDRDGKFSRLTRYLSFLRVPMGFQFELFEKKPTVNPLNPGEDGEARAEQILQEVEDAGFRAGLLGEKDNPHSPEGSAGQRWLKGWHIGNERRQQEARPIEEQDADDEDDA